MEQQPNKNKDRLREITESIESGIQELFTSDKYMQYLRTMSRFHKYSVNNTMLIYMQRPDATVVAGFNKWRDQFGRNVMKGEKGIKIIAPTPFKKKIEEQKLDPDTKLPVLDAEGKAIMEEKEVKVPMYKVVSVFDLAQTAGKPLPSLASDLAGNVQNYDVFMEALCRSAPVSISVEAMNAEMDGFFSAEAQHIVIRKGMSEVQTVSATVHEIAHSKLHNKAQPEIKDQWKLIMVSDGGTKKDFSGGFDTREEAETAGEAQDWRYVDENAFEWRLEVEEDTFTADFVKKSRNTEEVEAESVSYAVCAYYGIPTGENSFGYIATWSKGKELQELRASLETINKTASGLITDIDRNYAEIMKERGLDQTKQSEAQAGHEEQSKSDIEKSTPETLDMPSDNVVPSLPEEPPLGGGEIIDVTTKQYDPDALARLLPDAYPMPDPGVTIKAMHDYGYTDGDMLPLSYKRAVDLFERDLSIYMIYDGNGAGMVFDREDLDAHDGMFAVTREEWDAYRNSPAFLSTSMDMQEQLESRFLNMPEDGFAIYQVKSGEQYSDLRFERMALLKEKGITVVPDSYDLVYADAFEYQGNVYDELQFLFDRFNIDHPEDYHGRSASVSDIIALKQGGHVSYYYVDAWSFEELPNFKESENALKNAEMSVEDDYGMIDGIINNGQKATVTELEKQAISGQPISLMDLADAAHREQMDKRQSVMQQLKAPPQKEHKRTAPKGAEMER